MADPTRDPLDDAALASALRGARQSSGDHLSEAQWERLTCDEMSPAELDAALAHIMSCADCRTIHRSLIELKAGANTIEAQRPNIGMSYRRWTRPPKPWRRWTIAGGLATAAAIVAAVLINQPTRVAPTDTTRSARETGAVVPIAPIPEAVITDRRFAWRPVAGATSYELRVTTVDGVRVFTSRRDETSAVLPSDVALTEGSYYWRVLAFKGDAEIAASPLIPFKVPSG